MENCQKCLISKGCQLISNPIVLTVGCVLVSALLVFYFMKKGK